MPHDPHTTRFPPPACGWLGGLAILAAAILTGCRTGETIPGLRVLPNASGVAVGTTRSHGPVGLMGYVGEPPNVPPGTTLSIPRTEPLYNTQPRYFIPASGRLEVVSIERPAKYNTQSVSFERNVQRWRQFVADDHADDAGARTLLAGDNLSEIPWVDAARCFEAKLRRRTFPWGKAVLFLTSYVQGKTGGPVNNDMLVLTVQGFTDDGRYAVSGHFAIHHPKLPDSLWDQHLKGKAVFDIDDETRQAKAWLDAQPDDTFQPTFASYETFLAALRVKAP